VYELVDISARFRCIWISRYFSRF